MRFVPFCVRFSCLLAFLLFAVASPAADYPAPKEDDWIARDFRFHTGEVLPEVRLHYTTIGAPSGEPVLVLHGTAGSAASMLSSDFAGELFGPGQPLDAQRYFIILPDALGGGKSSKPSDGLRMRFPRYNYDDMVLAHYRLLTEHLGIKRLRLVIGQSMGGMQAWLWGIAYPDFVDALVPMACQPTEIAGRNWMARRMMIDWIKGDPQWNGGNYSKQPPSVQAAQAYFSMLSSGGTQALYKAAPTWAKADEYVNDRLKRPASVDANDLIYLYESSRDYNPAPKLDTIKARVLAINSADDERNPPELGILEREIKRVPNGRYLLIPGSAETRGHGTTGSAKWWKQHLTALLQRPVQAAR